MGFFDNDDPFESMIDRMFRGNGSFVEYSDGSGRRVHRRSDDASRNFVETKKFFYFVIDLSNKKSVSVQIKDGVVRNGFGERVSGGNKILEVKTNNGEVLEFVVPKNIAKRKFEWKFNNGILEVKFEK